MFEDDLYFTNITIKFIHHNLYMVMKCTFSGNKITLAQRKLIYFFVDVCVCVFECILISCLMTDNSV